jgi:uncharacterized alpha/beta hydrolase family protein
MCNKRYGKRNFYGIIVSFVVLVVIVVIGTNIYAQSDESRERQQQQQQQENTSVLNMTDKMKFFCIQV